MRALITFLKLTYLRLPFVMSQVIIPMWEKKKKHFSLLYLKCATANLCHKGPRAEMTPKL